MKRTTGLLWLKNPVFAVSAVFVATDGSALLGSISTSFAVPCCRYRCFRRFEVVCLVIERVLVSPGHNLHVIFLFLSSQLPISLKQRAYVQLLKVQVSVSNSIFLSNGKMLQAAAAAAAGHAWIMFSNNRSILVSDC